MLAAMQLDPPLTSCDKLGVDIHNMNVTSWDAIFFPNWQNTPPLAISMLMKMCPGI